MKKQKIYEISPWVSFLGSIAIWFLLISISAFIFSPVLFIWGKEAYKVVIITINCLNPIWVLWGFFSKKREKILQKEKGILYFFTIPIRNVVYSAGRPWILPGIIYYKKRIVGEDSIKITVNAFSKKSKSNAQIPIMGIVNMLFEIFDPWAEEALGDPIGAKSFLEIQGDSALREIIIRNTDERLMKLRSVDLESTELNLSEQIWLKLSLLDPDKDTDSVTEKKLEDIIRECRINNRELPPIQIHRWGARIKSVFVKDVQPTSPEVIKEYENHRRAQIKAKAETDQMNNLIKNASSLKNVLPGLSDRDAVTAAQIEDNKEGVKKIIIENIGNEPIGDFSKSKLIEIGSGKKKKDE